MNKKWISCLFVAVITVESSSHKIQAMDWESEGWTKTWPPPSLLACGLAASYVSKNFLYDPAKKICDRVRRYAPQSWQPWITPETMGKIACLGGFAYISYFAYNKLCDEFGQNNLLKNLHGNDSQILKNETQLIGEIFKHGDPKISDNIPSDEFGQNNLLKNLHGNDSQILKNETQLIGEINTLSYWYNACKESPLIPLTALSLGAASLLIKKSRESSRQQQEQITQWLEREQERRRGGEELITQQEPLRQEQEQARQENLLDQLTQEQEQAGQQWKQMLNRTAPFKQELYEEMNRGFRQIRMWGWQKRTTKQMKQVIDRMLQLEEDRRLQREQAQLNQEQAEPNQEQEQLMQRDWVEQLTWVDQLTQEQGQLRRVEQLRRFQEELGQDLVRQRQRLERFTQEPVGIEQARRYERNGLIQQLIDITRQMRWRWVITTTPEKIIQKGEQWLEQDRRERAQIMRHWEHVMQEIQQMDARIFAPLAG